MKSLLRTFLIWRIILFIPLIISFYLIQYRPNQVFTQVFNEVGSVSVIYNILLYPWSNFDGIHYLNIAREGYTNQARFFPLFPLMIKVVSSNILISVLLVSIIFFFSLFFLKKLIEMDFSKKIAKRSIFNLLLFPTSFFFVSVYSESLFLLLSVLSFYFVRKEKWFLASLCAMLLMTTRFVGLAIVPALIYEFFISEVNRKKGLYFLIIPLGLIAYSIFNYIRWGSLFYYILAQGELGNNRSVSSIILFPQTIYRYIKIFINVPLNTYEWGIAALELGSFIFASYLLFIAWKKGVRRSYIIFALINFAIAISTGTFSALPRYILVIFPVFIALALVKNKAWITVYTILSPVLLFILLMLFSRWYFVA